MSISKDIRQIPDREWTLIYDLFRHTLHLNVVRVSADFGPEQVSEVDLKIRTLFQNSDSNYRGLMHFGMHIKTDTFVFSTDNMLMSYLLIRPSVSPESILSIGPYLETPPDSQFYTRVVVHNRQIDAVTINRLRPFYESLPVITDNSQLLAACHSVLHYADIDSSSYEIQTQRLAPDNSAWSNQDPALAVDEIFLAEKRSAMEDDILDAILHGELTRAHHLVSEFSSIPITLRVPDAVRDRKLMLSAANAIYRKAVTRAGVHPFYAYQVNRHFLVLIDRVFSLKQLTEIAYQMIHAYCLLVQNHLHDNVPPIIQRTLNHIDLHLTENLTLARLADQLSINKSYLSRAFRQNTGTTITKYINDQRIHYAIRLLTSTDASIRTVAANVGIYDINYFTRLFKRVMKMTPTAYRKLLWEGAAKEGN